MKKVFKYKLQRNSEGLSVAHALTGPIVHAGFPEGEDWITVWIEGDIEVKSRHFDVFGTGELIPDHAVHVFTWFQGPFVWHLYELTPE